MKRELPTWACWVVATAILVLTIVVVGQATDAAIAPSTNMGRLSLRYELSCLSGRRFDMEAQEAKSWWVITEKYHPPKSYPRAEPEYVMGDDGPMLFDREKDAGRWKTHLRLGQRSWEVIEVYTGEDGKLHRAFPGWQRRLRYPILTAALSDPRIVGTERWPPTHQ